MKAAQRDHMLATIDWARKLRASLQPILNAQRQPVHFRPGSTGIAMVGLLHERPQRGESGLTNLDRVVADFDAMFATHCRDIKQGRPTGEKALQSFLIRESYKHGGQMDPINVKSRETDEPVELTFITDEIPLPVADGKIVCDVLALRRDGGRCVPVLLELKYDRQLTRLVEQVEEYSALVDQHLDLFAELFGALLGEDIHFDGLTEKWIVWPSAPSAGSGKDRREDKLAAKGIRVVTYDKRGSAYALRVGRGGVAPRARTTGG